MSIISNKSKQKIQPSQPSKKPKTEKDQEADVLYQRLNGRWYAFSVIDDEVFMGAIEPETFEESEGSKNKKDA